MKKPLPRNPIAYADMEGRHNQQLASKSNILQSENSKPDNLNDEANMDKKDHLSHEPQNEEAWICFCGNTPDSDGFFTCDANGNEVEPTPEDWKTDWYVCGRCGRMIAQGTLEVVGQSRNFKRLV